MQLTLRDRTFPIEQAILGAEMQCPHWANKWNGGLVPKPSFWLDLQAAAVDYDDETWSPHLTYDLVPYPSRDWRALANRKIAWTEVTDPATGERNGNMYVFGHHDIYEAELAFGDLDGLDLEVSWHGLCDIFWDDEFSDRVPFAVTARAHFAPVRVHGSGADDDSTFLERFALYLNPDDFVQGPVMTDGHSYEDGTTMTHCLFTPKTVS